MSKVEFIFKGFPIIILCNDGDLMSNICHKFALKVSEDIKNLYFYYSGNELNLDLKYSEIINNIDKQRKCMSVLVNSVNDTDNSKQQNIVNSYYPICPTCKESAKIEIKDFKINVSDCKNGHKMNNILLEEYEKSQKIDLTKIKCNVCNLNDKSKTYNNEMYICNTCKIYLCPLCKEKHDKNHNFTNYDLYHFMCKIHNESYYAYCKKCKENLCILCEKNHNNHETITYGKIIPNENELKAKLKEIKNTVSIFKNIISDINTKLKDVFNSVVYIYNINKELINNFSVKKLNYQYLETINNINVNSMMADIIQINEEKDIINQLKKIFNGYNKIKNTYNNISVNSKDYSNEITKNDNNSSLNDSLIIKDIKSINMIKNWISPNNNISFKLLYRATRDGDSFNNFHSKCNDAPNISFIKTDNGKVIGGYTTLPWKIEDTSFLLDKEAFIFSIDSKEKYNLNQNLNGNNAIYHCNSVYCCCYGYCGDDLTIHENFLSNTKSYCCGNGKYRSFTTSNLQMIGKDEEGKVNFGIKELEVYKVIDKNRMIDSVIIKQLNDVAMIKNWIKPDGEIYLDLIYRATVDGDSSINFTSKCKDYAPTISIIKLENGRIIGGYTTVPWIVEDKAYVVDSEAFIFSIDSKEKYELKKNLNGKYAIYHSLNRYCCCFGYCGDDLAVGDKFLKDQNSYCSGNEDEYYSFETNNLKLMGVETKGKINFKILELEVFKIRI